MAEPAAPKTSVAALVLAWAFVGSPLVWGIWETLKKAAVLFR